MEQSETLEFFPGCDAVLVTVRRNGESAHSHAIKGSALLHSGGGSKAQVVINLDMCTSETVQQ